MKHFLVLLLFLVFQSAGSYGQNKFSIHYLGNMGVAVVHNDSAIIIDGLHDFYREAYLPSDTAAIRLMLQKKQLFKHIVAIAITHRHDDHFDSTLVSNVAKIHPSALLTGSSQARAMLSEDLQKKFRVTEDSLTIHIKPHLSIHIRRIPHTFPQRHSEVENCRIEIAWNNFRIVHMGDADIKESILAGMATHPAVMIIPSWFVSESGTALIEKIKPVNVIVTHIAPGDKSTQQTEKLQATQFLFKKYGDKANLQL